MIEFIKAAGPGQRTLRRFFYALFTGTYFTYPAILALAPIRTPGSLWGLRLSSFGLCKHLFTGWVEQIRHLVGRDRLVGGFRLHSPTAADRAEVSSPGLFLPRSYWPG